VSLASSHLQARLDLYLRLRTPRAARDPQSALVKLSWPILQPVAATWKRNAPGVADELEVTLRHEQVPFDLSIIEGAAVDFWLFEHRDPSRCAKGDPGHVGGTVDAVRRSVIGDGTVTLTCRDWTGHALGTKISEQVLTELEFNPEKPPALVDVVRTLVSLLPGGETWRVTAIGQAGVTLVGAEPPAIRPGKPAKASKARRGRRNKLAPNIGQWVRPGQVSVWDAVSDVCVQHGVVPEVREVREGAEGRREVVLVSAQELQTSTILRPFTRGRSAGAGLPSRGAVRLLREGVDVTALEETLEVASSERRPDFVEVATVDAVTGVRRSIRWPPPQLDPKGRPVDTGRSNGVFQTIDAVSSDAELGQLAKDAWQGLAHNQERLSVSVPHPWSAGGGPQDPDLLDLAYGAGMVVERRHVDVDAVLKTRGLDAPTRKLLADADQRVREASLLWQVTEVTHQWGPAEYACGISLRRFLGWAGFDAIYGVDVDVPKSGVWEVA